MIEKSKEEQAAEARVSKMLAEALAEDLGDIPKVSITVEELKALERADRKRRRKRKLRYFGLAAAAVFVCVVALYALWPETAVPVSADKNTEQRVEEKDGMVVINEGDAEGGGAISYTEDDESKIPELKKRFKELVTLTYLPEGYVFFNLTIEDYAEEGFLAQYTFAKNKKNIYVTQQFYNRSGTKTDIANNNVGFIETKFGRAYIVQEGKKVIASADLDNGYIKVTGKLTTKEIAKIIDNIKVNAQN